MTAARKAKKALVGRKADILKNIIKRTMWFEDMEPPAEPVKEKPRPIIKKDDAKTLQKTIFQPSL